MSSPRVEPGSIFPLRRNALGYRFRANRGEIRQRVQLLIGLSIAAAAILAITL